MTVTAVHSRYYRSVASRSATIVVAASDAYSKSREQADFICDGVNDEVQIQAAIDALPVGGGIVQLSEGVFHCGRSGGSQIKLSSGAWLNGMGKATQLKLGDGIDQTFITNENATPLSESGTRDYDITVSNMFIDGNKANQGSGSDSLWCVGFSTVDHLRIYNLRVIGGWTTAIRTEFCKHVFVECNLIEDAGDDGIAINENTKFASVIGNIIRDCGQT